MESPETNLYTYNQLIFNKGGKNMQQFLQQVVLWKLESLM